MQSHYQQSTNHWKIGASGGQIAEERDTETTDKTNTKWRMIWKNGERHFRSAHLMTNSSNLFFFSFFFIILSCKKWPVMPVKQHWPYADANKPERHCYFLSNGPQPKITALRGTVCILLNSLGVSHSALISYQERQPDSKRKHITAHLYVSWPAMTTSNVKWILGLKCMSGIHMGFGKEGWVRRSKGMRYEFQFQIEYFVTTNSHRPYFFIKIQEY